MKVFTALFILTFLSLITLSCVKEMPSEMEYTNLDEELEHFLKLNSENGDLNYFSLPENWQEIPEDSKNKLTEKKIILGKFLFHEPGIGIIPKNQESAGTYSCASCHHADAGFQAGLKQGIGEGGLGFGVKGESRKIREDYGFDFLDIQPIRSPSILNTAYQKVMLWNGQFGASGVNEGTEEKWALRSPKEVNFLGFEGLESQAIAALKIHRLNVNKEIITELGYKEIFDEAFPDIEENQRYNDTIAGLAIAAYERSVVADQAPFQRWINGDKSALTESQKKGAILFFDEAGCVKCHTGPALSSDEFHALGMLDFSGEQISQTIAQDFFTSAEGRGGFTGKNEDLYKFKVPQLYNLKDSPFYGHGGSFLNITDVINYKNNAISENPIVQKTQLSDEFISLGLSNEEIMQIADFIENGLYDPSLSRYAPEALPSGNCFPNNDPQSRIDLNCN